MGYYPIFLEMKDRPCLVVGGGQVAQRKVEGLLAADAAVTVVSPDLTEALAALKAEGRIEHRQRDYQGGDLEGFAIVVAATDDKAANARVAGDGDGLAPPLLRARGPTSPTIEGAWAITRYSWR